MLPNKFFENIQSGTPVLTSNYPAISSLIDQFDVGLTSNPYDINEILKNIELMRTNRSLYNKKKKNVLIAKKELCWEKERKILYNHYKLLLR